jgi:hypothetical protein
MVRKERMSYFNAAMAVLRSAKRPLTIKEILEAAVRRSFIEPTGKTPERTLSAVLYRRAKHDPQLIKVASQDGPRAERGSVRWALVRQQSNQAKSTK